MYRTCNKGRNVDGHMCLYRKATLKDMGSRILQMRSLLYERMRALGTPGTWDHIVQQRGMFCYLGLSRKSLSRLVAKFHLVSPPA